MTALKKNQKATKCSEHHTVCLIAHAAKTVAGILRQGKGTRNASWMLIIISEQTLDIDEELCAGIIDWQKAFDCIKWIKLMQILNKSGINRRERRFIKKLYMDQNVK
jgi:hypothetical protein